ncbi:MAG TPA: GlsB/YeaQ/YmgE family stress response membrane protein [Erysipelothrix sp.]|nr:GlsB/YeaQ/YmgE family stress response membrane protein [Erysipelothrix sp.]
MDWIWTLIAGAIIGVLSGLFSKKKDGFVYNVIAGLAGASIGQYFFGSWGPTLAGMALVPAILGAVIFNALVNLIFNR